MIRLSPEVRSCGREEFLLVQQDWSCRSTTGRLAEGSLRNLLLVFLVRVNIFLYPENLAAPGPWSSHVAEVLKGGVAAVLDRAQNGYAGSCCCGETRCWA